MPPSGALILAFLKPMYECRRQPDGFLQTPMWYLGENIMKTVNELEILGVTFRSNLKCNLHVQNRIQKCRKALYSMNNVGMCYPGLNTSTKTLIYKTVCLPSMTYGMETVNLSKQDMKQLESFQGGIAKRICGIGKRSHHTRLVRAMNLDNVGTLIGNQMRSLYNNISLIDSPTRQLNLHILHEYMFKGILIPGTLVARIVESGYSPVNLTFHKPPPPLHDVLEDDGVVDSIRHLIYNENYIKPWCNEHLLVKLLTRAF